MTHARLTASQFSRSLLKSYISLLFLLYNTSTMVAADKLDWNNLGFQYRETNGYIKYTWTPEKGWDQGSWETDSLMKVHVCASGLHYGQQVCLLCLY